MENALRDINAVSGVTGCFVCSAAGQVLASTLPTVFDSSILAAVGRVLSRTMAGLATARRREVTEIDLVYDQNRLITQHLTEGCLLCIVCVRNINMPLLDLAAQGAAKELAPGLKAEAEETPMPRVEATASTAQPLGAAFLGQVERELARAIGPLAAIVVDEAIDVMGESRASFPRHKATVLVEKVGTEIADEEKRRRFTEAALQALRE
jgi:predicted regulator of Ras-like GTPase activity (Roadblock/LC7/MglB family)